MTHLSIAVTKVYLYLVFSFAGQKAVYGKFQTCI